MTFVQTFGSKALNIFTYLREILGLSKHIINSGVYERNVGNRVVRRTRIAQVYFTAVQPVPLIILIGFLIGWPVRLALIKVGWTANLWSKFAFLV